MATQNAINVGVVAGSGQTFTFPSATDTLVGRASTDTLTNKDLTSGTNTFPTFNQNTTGSAAKLTTGRTIAITGDLAYTSPSFDGSGNVTAAGTLATVNANVGSFGSATQTGTFTVNAKGLVTAASNTTITPAVGSITGLGTGVATALAVNVGTAGAPVVLNGAGGTPSSLTLTNATGLPVAGITASTSTALGVGSIELGNASDTTLSRSAAGVLAVEGVVIPSISSTNTLTNKRITKRVLALSAGSATPAINTDSYDVVNITAQSAAITSFTTNLTGTPVDGDTLRISITDNGTARAITWGTSFEASTVALPTTTVSTNRLDVGFVWNTVTSKWRCVAVA